jgi:hypothetical protein
MYGRITAVMMDRDQDAVVDKFESEYLLEHPHSRTYP